MKIWHKCHHLLSHSTLHSFTQALWRARITSSASTQPHGWKHGIFTRKMVCIMDKQCFITYNQEASANKLFQKTNCALQHKKVLLPRSKIHWCSMYPTKYTIHELGMFSLSRHVNLTYFNACKFLPSSYLFHFPGLPQVSNIKCSFLYSSINICICREYLRTFNLFLRVWEFVEHCDYLQHTYFQNLVCPLPAGNYDRELHKPAGKGSPIPQTSQSHRNYSSKISYTP